MADSIDFGSFVIPCFRNCFSDFFSAKNDHGISRIMIFYLLISSVVFFMPIAIGVLAHLYFPDLVGSSFSEYFRSPWTSGHGAKLNRSF